MNEGKPGEKYDPQTQKWIPKDEPFSAPVVVRSFNGWLLIIPVLLGVAAFLVFPLLIRDDAPDEAQATVPSPSPSVSAYETRTVELGTARAAAHVVATQQDPAIGQPQIASQLTATEGITGCDITDMTIEAFDRKWKAKQFVEESEHGAAWEKVVYAEEAGFENDLFAAVVVEARC